MIGRVRYWPASGPRRLDKYLDRVEHDVLARAEVARMQRVNRDVAEKGALVARRERPGIVTEWVGEDVRVVDLDRLDDAGTWNCRPKRLRWKPKSRSMSHLPLSRLAISTASLSPSEAPPTMILPSESFFLVCATSGTILLASNH